MPVFTVLNDEGLLCLYLINNFMPNVPSICTNSNVVPNLQYFTTEDVSNQPKNEPVIPQVVPAVPQAAAVLQPPIPTPQISAPIATAPQINFGMDPGSYSTAGMTFNMNSINPRKFKSSRNETHSICGPF